MDMLTIGAEQRASAQKTPQYAKAHISEREGEGYSRHKNVIEGRRLFLGFRKNEGTQDESHKKTACVTQKDGGRIKVQDQKTEQAAAKDRRRQSNIGPVPQCQGEDGDHGEQCRAGGQAVQTINKVDGIANKHHPGDSECKTNEPCV